MQENQEQGNSDLLGQSIDGILDNAMGGKDLTNKPVEGKRPPVVDPTEADERNAEYRAKKHREERDQLATKLSEKDQLIANLQGQMEAFKKFVQPETAQPEEDPTAYMTQTEATLYRGIKQLEEKLQELSGNVSGVQSKVVQKEQQEEEGRFYKEYDLETDEQKDNARELIKGFVKDEPELLQRLLNGKIKVGKLYEYALLQSGQPIFKNKISDPTKVFGNGRPETTPVRAGGQQNNVLDDARNILKDKDSSNKKKAVDAGISVIVDDLLATMMNNS